MNPDNFGVTSCFLQSSKAAILAAMALLIPEWVIAQAEPLPNALIQSVTSGRVYTVMDFERFAPRNALDMVNRVPGFSVSNDNQGRGLGQATTNVLINGKRLSSKSQNIYDQLRRTTVDSVDRIEIVDGATLELPGLSGQVANVITREGDISGQYEYRTVHRPKYAEPLWFGGEVSVSGSLPDLEWNIAYTHGTGRGGAGGPSVISNVNDAVTERRDVHIKFVGDFPSLSGSLAWTGDSGTVANLNVQYSRDYTDFSNDEKRYPVSGINSFRDFDNYNRTYGYEIGGDIEFDVGAGRLKVIGLESFDSRNFGQDSILIFADGAPSTGNRFLGESESGETIARAEYRWDMLGGDWEIDVEAAYNDLEQSSQFFNLENSGELLETSLPNGSGEVTEDRYEMIVTHGRNLTENLTMQLGVGGEKSELSQSGPGGLTRNFWRPKGSLSLAWTPNDDLDVSLNISRQVGQLSFSDFLASVSLALGNTNAGNVQLKPTLSWESNVQVKKSWGDWGSTNLQVFSNWHDDYIDIIPIPGGGESRGNIDKAQNYGVTVDSTINLDPLGAVWEGIRMDVSFTIDESSVDDPLTGIERPFSNYQDREAEVSLRHDIPGTDWAWGMGMWYNHRQPGYRLSQISRDYEGPTYTWAFIEHKNFYGATVNFEVYNLTDGRSIYHRTVYNGLRDNGSVSFNENRDLSVQPIFRLKFTGNF